MGKVTILGRHLVEKGGVSGLRDESGLNVTLLYGWPKLQGRRCEALNINFARLRDETFSPLWELALRDMDNRAAASSAAWNTRSGMAMAVFIA